MLEALALWNEPNHLSHWNFHLEWKRFSEMIKLASTAIRNVNPNIPVVLGGISACDCDFLRLMRSCGLMDHVDAVGVHGFPLDWNHWPIYDWPDRLREAADATSSLPGSPEYMTTFGAPPGDGAWERAHEFYLGLFAERGYSDIQDQHPLPLSELECEAGSCVS
jgi:hypothetical protein